MLPKIAIVGRPNVGKSALFNRICQKRISIVDEQEGITRDRLYAKTDLFGRPFELIDTGGIDPSGKTPFNEEIKTQALFAVEEADAILFVVDGQTGPTLLDGDVAKILRKSKKPIVLAVNKVDCPSDEIAIHQFQALGIPDILPISALQGYQIAELLELALDKLPSVIEEKETPVTAPSDIIRVAIVGRPNVGKSTLLNQLLEEERSIVSPIAGTTRDAIDASIHVRGVEYLLIDTAGIRRKKAEREVVDKFAAIRTEEAIDRADVCLLVLDSFEGFTTQEKRIASEIEAKGKSCILLFNKWDLVKKLQMEHALRGVREEIPFLAHCPTIFLSALHKRNLEKIFPVVEKVYAERYRRITTGQLNKFIEGCLHRYHPPLLNGKRLRIYYMTQVQSAPPKFVVFVNNPRLMVEPYRKYLVNQFRDVYQYSGCPIQFELRGKPKAKAADPVLPKEAESAEPLLIDQI
ncbi:MAG TPA: ribosome biogenesis GTPase Der [Chlamydiales bacterium]|jgi:GTP-binding protein|nr:ribosome biogenesis GTPase Der [Chlamydiales bacterium]